MYISSAKAIVAWLGCSCTIVLGVYALLESFLEVTGSFAWLARQEGTRKGKAAGAGTEKAKAKGENMGRPMVAKKLDADLVVRRQNQDRSLREIAEAHPLMTSFSGRKVKPSVGSVRRACCAGGGR